MTGHDSAYAGNADCSRRAIYHQLMAEDTDFWSPLHLVAALAAHAPAPPNTSIGRCCC